MLKKLQSITAAVSVFTGLCLAVMAGIVAFNGEMAKHYKTQKTDPEND